MNTSLTSSVALLLALGGLSILPADQAWGQAVPDLPEIKEPADAPKPPDAPKAPEAPEAPKAPDAPQPPDAPKVDPQPDPAPPAVAPADVVPAPAAPDKVKEPVREAAGEVRDAAGDARDNVRDAAGDVRDAARDARDATRDATRDVRDSARDALDTGREAVRDVRDTVRDVRGAVRDVRDTRAGARVGARADLDVRNMRGPDLGLWFTRSSNRLLINDISTTGPIAKLGFRERDYILSVNGFPISTEADFTRYLLADDVRNGRVKVVVWREGREQIVWVEPAVLIQEEQVATNDPLEEFGIVLDDRYPRDIIVWRVIPRSPAFYAGVRAGDTLVSFNGQRIVGAREFATAIQRGQGDVALRINRNRQVRDLSVSLQARGEVREALRPNLDATERLENRLDRRDDRQDRRADEPAINPPTERAEDRRDDRQDRREDLREDRADVNPPATNANPPRAATRPRTFRIFGR